MSWFHFSRRLKFSWFFRYQRITCFNNHIPIISFHLPKTDTTQNPQWRRLTVQFTVVCLVTWPMNDSETGVDLF